MTPRPRMLRTEESRIVEAIRRNLQRRLGKKVARRMMHAERGSFAIVHALAVEIVKTKVVAEGIVASLRLNTATGEQLDRWMGLVVP